MNNCFLNIFLKGVKLGWNTTSCPTTELEDDLDLEERVAAKWLSEYNTIDGEMMNKLTIAQWNYGANITDYNQEVMVRLSPSLIACHVIFRGYLLFADLFSKLSFSKKIFKCQEVLIKIRTDALLVLI